MFAHIENKDAVNPIFVFNMKYDGDDFLLICDCISKGYQRLS